VTISPLSGISSPNGITGTLTGISNAGGLSSQAGGAPVAAGYPLNDDGTLAASLGFGWLETDATAYNNADYTYTGAATGDAVIGLPTTANWLASQAIVVDTGTILACEAVINSASSAQFANFGLAAAVSSGGTPSGVAVVNSVANNGSPQWIVSGTGGTRARSGATSGYRVGIELNGNDGTITMRSSDGSALCSTTFTPGVAFTFYLFATDAGNPAAGQTASITLVPVGADMQLGYTTGATDFNGDPCPQGYAQWNRYDAEATITVSSDNLTATTASGWVGLRSNVGCVTGDYYVEMTSNADNSSTYGEFGIGTSAASLATYIGQSGDSAGAMTHGFASYIYLTDFMVTLAAGQTCGLEIRRSTDELIVRFQNSVVWTFDISALNGDELFLMASMVGASVTLNAGQSAFVYSVPSGCTAGLPA